MISFWEKRWFLDYNYLVVGGGITGLSAAISMKEKFPEAKVLVLERGILPSGASTKNAGFACFGSLTELLADIKNRGETETLALVEKRWRGLQRLKSRLGEKNIGYQNHGGYELLTENETGAMASLAAVNSILSPIFKSQVFTERKDLVRRFGFNNKIVKTLVYNPWEAQIDTGKMMKSLLTLARQQGVEILTGSKVLALTESRDGVEIQVENIQNMEPISFRADHVAVCTNAFVRELLPGLEITPGRGQVLVTAPIGNLPFKGTFHFDQGFYYFRNLGERILLGGGRNIDFERETSYEFEITHPVIDHLRQLLQEMIIPDRDFDIEAQWAGIMAFGHSKGPIVKRVSEKIVVGVRLGGMGVAIGSHLGDQICELIVSG